ncbi:uncharacterized protein LOC111027298 [Myzus persicae]|uniref:uncharacterized protein LOC111027298 n=1 Tax=Myzus persicae TaxID=13164 RepID=UPI000B9386D7|nr:uncharacterized protein LOC111027298 [Myzus persicae]
MKTSQKKHWPLLYQRTVCNFFSRFNINTDFLNDDPSTWDTQISYLHGKESACSLNVVNDTAERAVKLMEDFHGTLTKDDKKSGLLLQCIQEHRRLYPDCKKETLKKKI